mgnify:CR=1 FL=1
MKEKEAIIRRFLQGYRLGNEAELKAVLVDEFEFDVTNRSGGVDRLTGRAAFLINAR